MPAYAFGTERHNQDDPRGAAGAAPGDSGPGEQPASEESGTNPAALGDQPNDPGEASPSSDPAGAERERKKQLKRQRLANLAAARAKAKAKRDAAKQAASGGATERKASSAQATLDLTQLLYSLHSVGAALIKEPVFAITEEEAAILSKGITRVSDLYDVPFVDEKTRAWLNLTMALGQVYGPRVATVIINKKKKSPAPPPLVIAPFHPQRAQPQTQPSTIDGEQHEAEAASGD